MYRDRFDNVFDAVRRLVPHASVASTSTPISTSESMPSPLSAPASSSPSIMSILEFARLTLNDLKIATTVNSKGKESLKVVNEVCRQGSLMPLTSTKTVDTKFGQFEVMSAIVDSGATVPVMNPKTGRAYDVQESNASRRGVEYEVASGDVLACLGEKRMAVITAEGTLRGYSSQCAEVCGPLQAVRALLASKHAVCFGLGDGNDHLIINNESGEINRMRDDGVNFLQDFLIVPPEKIAEVMAELNEANEAASSFGRPGP